MLNPGAAKSFVTERLAQTLALALPRERADVIISGIGCTTTAVAKCRVNLCLKSTKDTNFCIDFSALVLRKLMHLATRRQVQVEDWAPFYGLCFADPEWGEPSHIDCIFDTEVYVCDTHQGLIQGPPGDQLMAINTALGWLAVGGKEDRPESATSRIDASHLATDDLDAALQRFGKVETVPQITHLT